ncbi:hypothetical protein B9J07_08350 [Sinorhizobium sp. LM21]|nr:hypothetical protein B9J07_08350 [Sinorhizobium sp. LM21]
MIQNMRQRLPIRQGNRGGHQWAWDHRKTLQVRFSEKLDLGFMWRKTQHMHFIRAFDATS